MSTIITYLFDPLCGWCYGASPTIERLGGRDDIRLELAPTGLFSGRGARTMDSTFAAYAWSNDERIERLTGQRFTEAYRTQVLNMPGGRFDSTTATLALTAVAMTAPEHELATLKALQEARYVHALDTSAVPVAAQLLRDAGLSAAAERLLATDAELLAANLDRIRKAQGLMQTFGAQGVPAMVVTDDRGSRLMRGDVLYGGFESLMKHLAAA
ncbi:MAG: DsbA family protein [Burkholderiales bacterium]